MEGFLVGGMLAAIFTGFVAYATAFAFRAEIAAAAPAYADRLFREVASQVIFQRFPVRARVLFRERAPSAVVASVQILRWMYGLFYGTLALLVGLGRLGWYSGPRPNNSSKPMPLRGTA